MAAGRPATSAEMNGRSSKADNTSAPTGATRPALARSKGMRGMEANTARSKGATAPAPHINNDRPHGCG